MAFIPVPDCVEVELRSTWNGQLVENTLWFQRQDGNITSEALATLTDDVAAFYASLVQNNLSSELTFREAFAKAQNSQSDLTHTSTTGLPVVGGNTAGGDANNVSIVVSFRTGLSGRSFRGRNYVPAIPKQHVANSQVSTSFTTPVVAAYNTLQAIVNDDGWDWVVASRFENGAPRTTGVATKITNAVITDNVVDSQRRRLPGRGA